MNRIPEPCLCGDPECPRCFPQEVEIDEDEAYERVRQEEVDDIKRFKVYDQLDDMFGPIKKP